MAAIDAHALHGACAAGDTARVAALLAQGADADALDPKGRRPLHMACTKDHVAVVEQLLAHGADIEGRASPLVDPGMGTPLLWACCGLDPNPRVVALLLAKGANVEAEGCDGQRPLRVASANQDDDGVVAQLLAAEADALATAGDGKTALHEAAISGNPSAVECLLNAGCSIDVRDGREQTPLIAAAHFIILNGWYYDQAGTVMASLLARGAQVNAYDAAGNTAFHYLCMSGCCGFVRMLLAGGASPTARNVGGKTPLHCACNLRTVNLEDDGDNDDQDGRPATVAALLAAGADVHALDAQGRTPLALACFTYDEFYHDEDRDVATAVMTVEALLHGGARMADVSGDLGSAATALRAALSATTHQELQQASEELQQAREQLATLGPLQELGVTAARAMAELAAERRQLAAERRQLAAERKGLADERRQLAEAQAAAQQLGGMAPSP